MRLIFFKLHLAIFLFGFTPILGKLISINAISLVFWRVLFTIIILGIYFFLNKKMLRVSANFLKKASIVSILTLCNWIGFYACIKLSNVSIAMITFSLIGLFTAIIEPIIFKEKFSTIELGLGGISFIGILLIYNVESQYQLGIIVGCISAFFSALNSVANRHFVKNDALGIDGNVIMFYEMLICLTLLPLIILCLPNKLNLEFALPQNIDWIWILCLSFFCTVLSFRFILDVFQHLSTFTVNISFNMEPVYGICMAFIFFNENKYFSNTFAIGASMVLFTTVFQMTRLLLKKPRATLI